MTMRLLNPWTFFLPNARSPRPLAAGPAIPGAVPRPAAARQGAELLRRRAAGALRQRAAEAIPGAGPRPAEANQGAELLRRREAEA
mgnify:CR=1 FL=1